MKTLIHKRRGASLAAIAILVILVAAVIAYFAFSKGGIKKGSGSALEMAALIPSDCHAAWGWDLNGQLDYVGWVKDFKELQSELPEEDLQDFKKFEDKTIKTESKKVPEITEKIINEAEKAIFKKGKKQIKRKKINILSFLIVIIITFVALVILADTFKNSLTLIIPGFDLVLNSLYETTKDIMLFIKDLIK